MDGKSAEEREEARLQKSLERRAAAARNPAKKWSDKQANNAKPAAAAAAKPAPKKAESSDEEDNRDSRPTEAGKIRGAGAGEDDDRFSSLLDGATQEDIRREQTIIAAAKGQITPDRANVKEAVEVETERLNTIFRVQHSGFKQKWAVGANADVRQQNIANEEAARKAESEYAEQQARYEKEQEEAYSLRKEHAKADKAAADSHYASGIEQTNEPYLNDLELDLCEALPRLREEPSSFLPALKRRNEQIEGLLCHFVCHDGIQQDLRLKEGHRGVEGAIAFMESKQKEAPLPSLTPSKGLTKAMYEAVQQNPEKPPAMKLLQKYGKVSGSARQISYHGPCGTADDMLCGLVIDDGNAQRTRRNGIFESKFRKFGVCGGISEDGKTNYMYLVFASNFEEKDQ